jgi:hypothetical protein
MTSTVERNTKTLTNLKGKGKKKNKPEFFLIFKKDDESDYIVVIRQYTSKYVRIYPSPRTF